MTKYSKLFFPTVISLWFLVGLYVYRIEATPQAVFTTTPDEKIVYQPFVARCTLSDIDPSLNLEISFFFAFAGEKHGKNYQIFLLIANGGM